jgi:hypothetical protein
MAGNNGSDGASAHAVKQEAQVINDLVKNNQSGEASVRLLHDSQSNMDLSSLLTQVQQVNETMRKENPSIPKLTFDAKANVLTEQVMDPKDASKVVWSTNLLDLNAHEGDHNNPLRPNSSVEQRLNFAKEWLSQMLAPIGTNPTPAGNFYDMLNRENKGAVNKVLKTEDFAKMSPDQLNKLLWKKYAYTE